MQNTHTIINQVKWLSSIRAMNIQVIPHIPAPIAPKIVALAFLQKIRDPEENRPIMLLIPRAIIKYWTLSVLSWVCFIRSKT